MDRLMSHYVRPLFHGPAFRDQNCSPIMQGVEIADYLAHGTPERTRALVPGEEARARIA